MMPETRRQTDQTDGIDQPCQATGSGDRVAMLCDAPPLARLLDNTLARFGLAARHLPPAAQALRALRAAPPAVLIVLLMGRDPCALALCQSVGQDPAFATTQLVIVQDSMREIDLRRARAFGAVAVLPLPLDPAALRAVVLPLMSVPA